jgi:hypothetical protein
MGPPRCADLPLWGNGLLYPRPRLYPAPPGLSRRSWGPALAAGGEQRNYPNYSPASAAVASAATPSRERPRPRPERGNRRALGPGRWRRPRRPRCAISPPRRSRPRLMTGLHWARAAPFICRSPTPRAH